jgi:hypothetical protein
MLPRRWVVERTFTWIDQNRRTSKDCEGLPEMGNESYDGEVIDLLIRPFGRFHFIVREEEQQESGLRRFTPFAAASRCQQQRR